ncbi:hypothetical protein OG333_27740 [Streptomyces anulatus]|uniref:hypothetical protein n=1 Tax=Streptomyces anulatus TaxID=1892 RepID=UPI003863B3E7|nr:hypothetical protein OG333_27740 [Streptomyces anulatus]
MADVYRWHLAPDGLATRRQLRALGLRPGGQDVVAELHRPMTPARADALAAAMRARRTCPTCRTDAGYCIPRSLGMCVTGHDTPTS